MRHIKNKKGQSLGLSIIMAIMIFLIGMTVLNILKPEITTARDSNNLDCANTAISDGNKLTCLVVDIALPYFILLIISVAGGYITARMLL